ncbi:hypothetical protein [Neobacillus piezotolerans]|uniref:hypothetical protein n=1 Tax=Neobacillus piezotolerans TaxID=2259171 RepID=UPI0011591881|nr:hypothetical protein [Neobacillus piezotolerans]
MNKNHPQRENYKKLWRKVMRDKIVKHQHNHNISDVKKEGRLEVSEIDYGLEAVEKGTDFAEGDQNDLPYCGGL